MIVAKEEFFTVLGYVVFAGITPICLYDSVKAGNMRNYNRLDILSKKLISKAGILSAGMMLSMAFTDLLPEV